MDRKEFCDAAMQTHGVHGAVALAARAKRTGNEELITWLFDSEDGMQYASCCSREMMSAVTFVKHEQGNFAQRDPLRDFEIIRCNSPWLMTELEKKGWDPCALERRELHLALRCTNALMWLSEKIDLTSKILALPVCTLSYSDVVECLAALRELNCPALAAHVAHRCHNSNTCWFVQNSGDTFDREFCLLEHGAVLRALMAGGARHRARMRKLLTVGRGFSRSDFASAGL